MDTEEVRKSLLGKFREVTADRLEKVALALLALENDPEAAAPYEDVSRELHTLKGEARMLSLPAIAQLAHAAEDLLKAAREKRVEGNVTDLLLRACDAIGELIDDVAAAEKPHAASEALALQMARATGTDASPAAAPAAAAPAEGAAEAARGAEAALAAARADRSIRVAVDALDDLGSVAGDLLVEGARAQLRVRELAALMNRVSRLTDRWLFVAERVPETVRAAAPFFAQLETEVHHLRDDAFGFTRRNADGVHTLHGALERLGESVGRARLVPLSTVFNAFPRAVRDMAKSQDKEVELTVDNADVGVDRGVLGEIRDALVHLLRNAVDHGIESPDGRAAGRKPPVGRIAMAVRLDGDMLAVQVEDDGRGLDVTEIKAAAVAKGLITEPQAAAMTDPAAWGLIFLPGFSTRREVSELSGRGVGMDVVKQKVESLGGSVAVFSRAKHGTRVTLRLPQTLALMKVLLIRVGRDVYGLPETDVEGVGRVGHKSRELLAGTVTVRWRGRPVTVVPLGPLLGLAAEPREEDPYAVYLRHGEARAAFTVDGFLGEREVAVKPCGGKLLKGARFLGGAAALEDGRVAVLLHVPDLMAEVRKAAQPAAVHRRALRVLLVEDSAIARATEVALVRSLGHVVVEAVDGEDAVRKLATERYDVVITDIQMPRMDGIALTRKIKADPAMSKMPVVVISSLTSTEDKRRGLDAGADAYLFKGELTPESVAQALGRLA